jgi:CheY-like chemotaxis protein
MAAPHERTVLVVDDDEGVMTLLNHAMQLLGWRVLTAMDGQNALAQWSEQIPKIDLLITDLHMPDMNGVELARRIRELRPTLPIVFVSGDSGSDLAEQMATIPDHRYLKKPFRTAILAAVVSSLVA